MYTREIKDKQTLGIQAKKDQEIKVEKRILFSNFRGAIHNRDHKWAIVALDDKNFDISQRDIFGNTPLIIAVRGKYCDPVKHDLADCHLVKHQLVERLLNCGVDVNIKNSYSHDTALTYAAKIGLLEIVQLLLSRGADLSIANDFGNPLVLAALCGNHDVLEYLLDHCEPKHLECSTGDYFTPLIAAAYNGCLEIVKLILSKCPDMINKQNRKGDTALMVASSSLSDQNGPETQELLDNKFRVVKALIEGGADLYCQNSSGYTALMHAVEGNKVKTAELLILSGADIYKFCKPGRSAISIAVSMGHLDAAKVLFKGKIVEVTEEEGGKVVKGKKVVNKAPIEDCNGVWSPKTYYVLGNASDEMVALLESEYKMQEEIKKSEKTNCVSYGLKDGMPKPNYDCGAIPKHHTGASKCSTKLDNAGVDRSYYESYGKH